jgi:ankyrin repeat protein
VPESLANEFLRLACLDYEHWNLTWGEKAQQMLAEHPEVARANVYTAAAAGDVEAVREFLASDPSLVSAKGGIYDWEPLLYACYSRIGGATLDVARVLLDAGADPNSRFLWHGNLPSFTALTGAFGGGEAGANNPPHPASDALAKLLLDAGADPNDGQTLYNRHFLPDDSHLRLLLAYGLDGMPMLVEELWSAARRGYFERVKLLVEHGVDVNAAGRRDGRTPYQAALRAGNDEIAEYLVAHGAKRVAISDDERFAVACINGRREEALALIANDPARVEKLGHHGRVELMHRAVEANRPEGVRLMSELGFELSEGTRHDSVGVSLAATPLHNAAWMGNLPMIELLVSLGADVHVRDPSHHGTPLDWAAFNRQQHIVDYLRALV